MHKSRRESRLLRLLRSVSQLGSLLAVVAVAELLASCTNEIAAGAPEAIACRPAAAQRLVSRPTDSEIKFLTKATIVRRSKPGDMLTEDFREDRVTVVTDATGRVISAKCG